MVKKLSLAVSFALAAPWAMAGSTLFDNFTPLASSVAAGSLPESAPFLLSAPNFSQTLIADRNTQLAAGNLNTGAWDMITLNENGPSAGRFLFTPFESGQAGIQRTDLLSGTSETIWISPRSGAHVAFDASYWTPWGTYITAEERWGGQPNPYGRVFEATNPLDRVSVNVEHRNAVPRVSHEGMQFDSAGNFYFIDELNGGSIYRFTSTTPGASSFFEAGQTSVLRVGDGSTANATGAASWVPFTDTAGNGLAGAITITDPNGVIAVDGRETTNLADYKGTDYQRPEDLQVKVMPNGEEVLFFAATTTDNVYSINLATNTVRTFADQSTIDAATGLPVAGVFNNADNLAMDAAGNIYIIEDQPGGSADIWMATDADNDGVAESLARWATLSTVGAEPTGLYFSPFDPNVAFVNVQHPASGNDSLIMLTATAVPEPGTYAMMLAGLGLIGGMARRRQSSGS